jgi:hypothetical protein
MITRRRKTFFTALVCGIALAACSSDPIEMSGDPAAIPAFSTFQIHDEQYVFAEVLSEQQRAKISTELRQAVVQALKERGYREDSPPDVLVVLGAISRALPPEQDNESKRAIKAVDPRVLESDRPDVPSAQPEDRPIGTGREGDLILYLLDPKTQRTIWRASSSGSATTPAEALRKARATYHEMARKLPRAAGS